MRAYLDLLGRDGGIAVDELRENASECFDTQGQGRHVQQEDVLHASPQNASLEKRHLKTKCHHTNTRQRHPVGHENTAEIEIETCNDKTTKIVSSSFRGGGGRVPLRRRGSSSLVMIHKIRVCDNICL